MGSLSSLAGPCAYGSCALEQAGFRSCEATGCLVVVDGFGNPAACGILVPRLGIEPRFPAVPGIFLTTGPPGNPPSLFYIRGWEAFCKWSNGKYFKIAGHTVSVLTVNSHYLCSMRASVHHVSLSVWVSVLIKLCSSKASPGAVVCRPLF